MSIIDCKESVAKAIYSAIECAFEGSLLNKDDILNAFEYPPDNKMGDIALPCFKLAKVLRNAPNAIAEKITANIGDCDAIERTEAINGYLNIYISSKYLVDFVLKDINNKGENFGKLQDGEGKIAVFDYSSPNVAKPFHVGHLGSTVIGHSLKLMHEFAGWTCIGVNHLGDWGTQFGKLIVAYNLWGDKETVQNKGIDELVSLYVKFHSEAEKDPSLDDQARAEFTKLEQGDEKNLELWKWFVDLSIEEYKKTYNQLGVTFDYYTGESFYTDKIPEVLQILKDKKITKIDQGATIVDLEEHNMPPCLILKSDGSTLYAARDLAAAIYRKRTFNFDKCVYVTSAGQSLHFAQWFCILGMMGMDWNNQLTHVPYGTVSIDGGKLATRTGNVILLKDIFAQATEKVKQIISDKNPDLENKDQVAEEVGVGAIVFHYLSNNRVKDINFVIDDVLSFDGNTGPYAQYTYARCNSIIEKNGGVPEIPADYTPEKSEKDLLFTLSRFPEVVREALKEFEPMLITRFILDVCAAFNRFYNDCRIVGAENETMRDFRVALTNSVRIVLENALHLICLKTPKKI